MSKMTPGPWYVDDHRGNCDIAICADDNPNDVGRPVAWVGANRTYPNPANARLIAAAPDLLKALVYVHRFGSHGEIDDDEDENNGKSVSYFVESAIARATTPSPTDH